MSQKELLVTSIFAPSEYNKTWYQLQKQFIARTTRASYDYGIITNGISSDLFEAGDVLHSFSQNEQHSKALYWLLDYARKHEYKNYLFLDSDCFPVRAGWYQILNRQMERFGRKISAPYRTENLDVFPHPCAMFIKGDFIHDARINLEKQVPMRNLLNEQISDVGTGMSSITELIMPLLRTNVVNPHPLACAIYHHLFYHHGAGSRGFHFRLSKKYGYTDHWYDRSKQHKHGQFLYQQLTKNPEKFIAYLSGKEEKLINCQLVDRKNKSWLQRLFG